jgi:hypothetical protein
LAERDFDVILNNLVATLEMIKSVDPNGDQIDIEAIYQPFDARLKAILARDIETLKEIEFQLPTAAGLNARESFDKLYRDRFEALPQRFQQTFQSLE